jgi:hypothetical protein
MNKLPRLTNFLGLLKTWDSIRIPGIHPFPIEHLQSLPQQSRVSVWLVCPSLNFSIQADVALIDPVCIRKLQDTAR